MKQISCEQMGGPCKAMISGTTSEEMIANGMKHLEQVHPDMAKDVANMSKEDLDKWNATFQKTWADTKET